MSRPKGDSHEDDFSFSFEEDEDAKGDPCAQFNYLMNEGSAFGLHIIASVDTFNNVNRFISRKALSEFEMRVLFQIARTTPPPSSTSRTPATSASTAPSSTTSTRAIWRRSGRMLCPHGATWITEVAANLGR